MACQLTLSDADTSVSPTKIGCNGSRGALNAVERQGSWPIWATVLISIHVQGCLQPHLILAQHRYEAKGVGGGHVGHPLTALLQHKLQRTRTRTSFKYDLLRALQDLPW